MGSFLTITIMFNRLSYLSLLIALLSGCQATPPQPTAWVPKVNDAVVTNWCADCKDHVGRPYVATVTAVKGKVVFAKEFPAGITVDWVKSWAGDPSDKSRQ